MHIHQLFELISVIGIIIGLVMLYAVVRYKNSDNQKNLILICCATLVIDLGNYFILFSDEYQALLHGYQLMTIGHIFVLTAYILLMAGYSQIRIKQWIKNVLVLVNFVSICLCLTCSSHNLFFYDITYISDTTYPYLKVTPGLFFLIFRIVNVAFVLTLSVMAIGIAARKSREEAKKYYFIIASCVTSIIGDLVTELDIVQGFNFVATGVTVSIILIGIAMVKYGILDVMQVAKDNLIEKASEGVVVVDTDRELLYYNEKAGDILPFLIYDSYENTKEQLEKIFNGEQSMIQTQQGYYEVKISELLENETLKGYMAWFFDLSSINKYTEEIVALKEYADQANMSKTYFLANMSHEIRTPMNAIVGFNELIYQKTDDEEIREYASDIKTASSNLLSIINDILDLSKLESGKMELKCSNYLMEKLINESVINIVSKAKNKGLEFIQDIDEGLPYELYGDENHIRNILINLLNNAVKYTQEGFIKLIIKLEDMLDDEAIIRFSVADSGIGIKEEDMPKLFAKFEKFDSKRNSGIEGTGLGLAIVKGYVELMGGDIDVESEYEIGSTFSVVLKQKIVNYTCNTGQESKAVPDIVSEKKFKAPKARILVTDDNVINLKVTASLLKTYDIKVDVAESGKQAIEMCSKNPYDIIFMDHMMPEMDGIEAMKKIRELADDDMHNSIIIALTANAISGVKEILEEEGFDGYISKPIDIVLMENMLLKYLPEKYIIYVDDKEVKNEVLTEKEIMNMGEEKTVSNAEEKKEFSECLEGFNVEQGIINCGGDEETYIEILNIYDETGEERIADLQRFLEAKDYKNYIIAVHGIKSSSASIGAVEFSERAKKHEFAGKEERYDFIHEDFDGLIEEYRQVLQRVRAALNAKA